MLIIYAALIAVPIRPVWITTTIMPTTYGLRGFDIPYLMTNGGLLGREPAGHLPVDDHPPCRVLPAHVRVPVLLTITPLLLVFLVLNKAMIQGWRAGRAKDDGHGRRIYS